MAWGGFCAKNLALGPPSLCALPQLQLTQRHMLHCTNSTDHHLHSYTADADQQKQAGRDTGHSTRVSTHPVPLVLTQQWQSTQKQYTNATHDTALHSPSQFSTQRRAPAASAAGAAAAPLLAM